MKQTMTKYKPHACLLHLALLLLAACGCGKNMVKVEGKVLLDDKPMDGATVTFHSEDGSRPATGMTGSDGVFHLTTFTTGDGARPGDYKVIISRKNDADADITPPKPDDPEAMKAAMMQYMAKAKKASKKTASLPPEYTELDKTPLKCRVPTDGPVEFKLRSSGGT
jgi:hypothetical protein